MSNRDMSTPGDALARGAKSATYRVPSNYEQEGPDIKFNKTVAEELPSTVDNFSAKAEHERIAAQDKRIAEMAAHDAAVVVEWDLVKNVTAKPMDGKVLVWRIPEHQSILQLADTDCDKPIRCRVVAAGGHKLYRGAEVLIRTFSGTEVTVDGLKLTVILNEDILLVL